MINMKAKIKAQIKELLKKKLIRLKTLKLSKRNLTVLNKIKFENRSFRYLCNQEKFYGVNESNNSNEQLL